MELDLLQRAQMIIDLCTQGLMNIDPNRYTDWDTFLWPSIKMGIGIAIDVFLATIAQFRNQRLTTKSWTLPIMGTHIGLPAIGYYGFVVLAVMAPTLEFFWGVIGFLLVALFIYEQVCKFAGTEPIFGISGWISNKIGWTEDDTRLIIAIMAVSWDALLSGPAKAAVAMAYAWSWDLIIVSFVVAGLTVAVIAEIGFLVAMLLRRIKFSNPRLMGGFTFLAKFFELSVIGGFGVLSLIQGLRSFWECWQQLGEWLSDLWEWVLSDAADLNASIYIAAGLLFVAFLLNCRRMYANDVKAAEEAIEGKPEDTPDDAA